KHLHRATERKGAKRDSRRPPVFTRIGKKVVGDQTADLQYRGTHENDGWRTNVHARLGSRDVHDRLGRRRSLSENKRMRMPANVKTYDGTGDPDDHLKIFESAATIKNWPQPVWCHMFNSTLAGNAQNWFKDAGKLGPKWEGPYEVTEAQGNSAYKLRDIDGRELPRTWNICNLKRCYL
nr:reverse transcriptase domain-containing protein [Tanacetum cinerariifolium]